MPTKKWTEEEEEFLRANYIESSNAELAEKFGITKNAVQKKLARMGLKRSETTKEPKPEEASSTKPPEEEKAKPVDASSHFALGNKCFFEDQDYKQAIAEYQQAVDEESDDLIRLRALYWMAESHVKVGDLEEALERFRNIAEENETHYLGDSAKRRVKSLEEYLSVIG